MSDTIYTIGHSTYPIDKFIGLLQRHDITAVADVRSTPYSRFNPQYNKESLKTSLLDNGIHYVFLGDELGARSKDASVYENGRVSYHKLAQTSLFRRGLERLREGMRNYTIAMMCAEKEPLHCHRTILVSRELERCGINVAHILEDGSLEMNRDAIARLRRELKLPEDMFRRDAELADDAYDAQEKKIAYVIQQK